MDQPHLDTNRRTAAYNLEVVVQSAKRDVLTFQQDRNVDLSRPPDEVSGGTDAAPRDDKRIHRIRKVRRKGTRTGAIDRSRNLLAERFVRTDAVVLTLEVQESALLRWRGWRGAAKQSRFSR